MIAPVVGIIFSEHMVTFHSGSPPMALPGPVTLPNGHFFLIGDNRADGWDSRPPGFGCVARSRILAKVIGEASTFRPVRGDDVRVEAVGSGTDH